VYVDKQRYVPLLTRYWDDRKIEVKELKADPSKVELIDGVWVTRRLTMRHLKHQSFTTLELRSIEPNPELPDTTFELRRLESH
jgi:outer membrane lipoprotein-sorting protein